MTKAERVQGESFMASQHRVQQENYRHYRRVGRLGIGGLLDDHHVTQTGHNPMRVLFGLRHSAPSLANYVNLSNRCNVGRWFVKGSFTSLAVTAGNVLLG